MPTANQRWVFFSGFDPREIAEVRGGEQSIKGKRYTAKPRLIFAKTS